MEATKSATPTGDRPAAEHPREPLYGVPKGIWDRVIGTLRQGRGLIEVPGVPRHGPSDDMARVCVGLLSEVDDADIRQVAAPIDLDTAVALTGECDCERCQQHRDAAHAAMVESYRPAVARPLPTATVVVPPSILNECYARGLTLAAELLEQSRLIQAEGGIPSTNEALLKIAGELRRLAAAEVQP